MRGGGDRRFYSGRDVPVPDKEEKDDVMAEYLILIYTDGSDMDERQFEGMSESYQRFMAAHASVLRGGAALDPAGTATSVRPDGSGGFAVTDGVFAETKEVLGGYFVIDVPDLDAALAVAREIPSETGVEVRPIRMSS
jgi:hypothetical protein